MALKHGCTAPTGITLTGVLIHKVDKDTESVSIESMDDNGAFEAGKELRKKTTLRISGEMLSTAALPSEGSGSATAASPRIDRVRTGDENEKASSFEVEAHYFEAPEATPDY